jgi:peptidase M1-like protein
MSNDAETKLPDLRQVLRQPRHRVPTHSGPPALLWRDAMFLRVALLCFLALSASAAVPPKLRLDDSVRPVRYAADLTLRTEASMFSGIIDIDVQLSRPASLIWLNAVGITIREAEIKAGGRTEPAAVEPGDANFVGLRVNSIIPAGPAHLRIRYNGRISIRDTAGIFQGRDGGQTYLYTQFESTNRILRRPGRSRCMCPKPTRQSLIPASFPKPPRRTG